jgi:Holliday junction resolvase RusA-like endonuclease
MKRSSVTDEMIAKVLASGGRVLTTRLPESPLTRFEPFLVEFLVTGRPVPWSAPTVLKSGHAFKGKRLVAWQGIVKDSAVVAMKGHEPYAGPVLISMRFFLKRSGNGSLPDLSNLVKSTEDALQGVVIVNDRQVCRNIGGRYVAAENSALIKVTSIEEE